MNAMDLFRLKGIVKPYTGNGRRLGYPTANIQVPPDTAEGLFVGYAEVKGNRMPALIYIGAPLSLGDRLKRAEAHILDFADEDLYGEGIVMEISHRLRDVVHFDTEADLIKQMHKDEKQARKFFESAEKA